MRSFSTWKKFMAICILCFFGSACLMLHQFITHLVFLFFRILQTLTRTTSLIPGFLVVVLSFWQDSNVTFSQVLGTLPFIALQRQVDPGNTWEDRGSTKVAAGCSWPSNSFFLASRRYLVDGCVLAMAICRTIVCYDLFSNFYGLWSCDSPWSIQTFDAWSKTRFFFSRTAAEV